MKVNIVRIESDTDWLYELNFSWTRHTFGFGFRTPNYATGYYANPVTAIRNFMYFTSKRDLKITKLGG